MKWGIYIDGSEYPINGEPDDTRTRTRTGWDIDFDRRVFVHDGMEIEIGFKEFCDTRENKGWGIMGIENMLNKRYPNDFGSKGWCRVDGALWIGGERYPVNDGPDDTRTEWKIAFGGEEFVRTDNKGFVVETVSFKAFYDMDISKTTGMAIVEIEEALNKKYPGDRGLDFNGWRRYKSSGGGLLINGARYPVKDEAPATDDNLEKLYNMPCHPIDPAGMEKELLSAFGVDNEALPDERTVLTEDEHDRALTEIEMRKEYPDDHGERTDGYIMVTEDRLTCAEDYSQGMTRVLDTHGDQWFVTDDNNIVGPWLRDDLLLRGGRTEPRSVQGANKAMEFLSLPYRFVRLDDGQVAVKEVL
jgi:hypothetical protein